MAQGFSEGGRARQTNRPPLPVQICKIREESSIIVSNLPWQISNTELEAMFLEQRE